MSSILRWESILIDPLGAILALLVFDVIIATQQQSGLAHIAAVLGLIVGIGIALGAAGGYLYGIAIRKRIIPDYLRDYSALAAVLLVFAAAEFLMDYLKSRAPFWKKEHGADGAGWVAARDEDEDALKRW